MIPQDKLSPLLECIQQNPEDIWSWMQLGDVAKRIEDWDTSLLAYLAACRLDPNNQENKRKLSAAREQYILLCRVEKGGLHLKTFKLPYRTAVILLIGILNFDTDNLQITVKKLLTKGFKKIILDCSGLQNLSGLGPSTLRNLGEWAKREQSKMALVKENPTIKEMLKLKEVSITSYADLPEAFLGMND